MWKHRYIEILTHVEGILQKKAWANNDNLLFHLNGNTDGIKKNLIQFCFGLKYLFI